MWCVGRPGGLRALSFGNEVGRAECSCRHTILCLSRTDESDSESIRCSPWEAANTPLLALLKMRRAPQASFAQFFELSSDRLRIWVETMACAQFSPILSYHVQCLKKFLFSLPNLRSKNQKDLERSSLGAYHPINSPEVSCTERCSGKKSGYPHMGRAPVSILM